MSEHEPMRLEKDFDNHDYLFDVLAGENRAEQERLRKERSLTDEQLAWGIYYARLRQRTHQEQGKQSPTNEASIYRDGLTPETLATDIEPQVRYAVAEFNHKGYGTRASGFTGVGEAQHILFRHPIDLPDGLAEELAKEDIRLTLEDDGTFLKFMTEQQLTLEELTEIWKRIVDAFPPRK